MNAGSIPSYKGKSYFSSDPVYRYYFVAMFSYSTSQKDNGSWTNGAPGSSGIDLSTMNVSFPYNFNYDKRVKSVSVTPFNQSFLSGKSSEDQSHWTDVFNDSRPESWRYYRDMVSHSYNSSLQGLSGIGTKNVSFTLKLGAGSKMDATLPEVVIAPGGNKTETHYFPMLLTIDVEPTLEVHYFTKDGQSLDSVFGSSEKTMSIGSTYTVTPPTNPKYTYVGYKQGSTPPSGGAIQSGTYSFNYDGSYDTRYVNLYYDTTGSGTINVRHMVRTGDSGSYTQAGTSTIPVASVPNTQTVSPTPTYGNVKGSSLSYSGYSDTVSSSLSQSVSLTASKKAAYVTFFYQKDSSGIEADFDVVPSTIKYGDSFKYEPKNVQVGSCKYNYTKFRTQKGSVKVDSDRTLGIFYGLNFSKPSEYPSVVSGPGTYDVMMLINSSCGDTWVGPKTLTVTSDDTDQPPPTPSVNNPPYATVAFFDHATQKQTGYVEVGRFVDLKITSMTDPDGDPVSVQSWDMSDWINDGPPGGTATEYKELSAQTPGIHTVTVTVADDKGKTYTAKTQLTIVKSDPIAVISGPGRVKEGRTLNPLLKSESYSPLGYTITEEHWTNKQDSYPNVGEETVTLWVKDDHGNSSTTATKTIDVIPDEPPVISLDVPQEETRLGTVLVRANAFSPDSDKIASIQIQMKYDANNNGFDDDSWQTVQTGLANTYSFKSSKVGKYLFRATATEDYGKVGTTDNQAEATRTVNVLNLAPAIDVVTSSDQTGAPDRNMISLNNLYQNGTLTSLDTGSTGDKKSWVLNNEGLTSKANKNNFNVFQQDMGWWGFYKGAVTGNGNTRTNETLFASIQNTPSAQENTQLNTSVRLQAVTDESRTYIFDMENGTITAFNDITKRIDWTIPRQNLSGELITRVGSAVVGDILYLAIQSSIGGLNMTNYLESINKNTGLIIKGPTQVLAENGLNVEPLFDRTGVIINGWDVPARRYDYNFNQLFTYPSDETSTYPSQGLLALDNGVDWIDFFHYYAETQTHAGGYEKSLNRPDGTMIKSFRYTQQQYGTSSEIIGNDSDNNIYLVDLFYKKFLKINSETGQTLKTFDVNYDFNRQFATIIGLDAANHFVYQPSMNCKYSNGSCVYPTYVNYEYRLVGMNTETGQTVYDFNVSDPNEKLNGRMMGLFNGSDGLTTFYGLYSDLTTHEVYLRLVIYDSINKNVVHNYFTDLGIKGNDSGSNPAPFGSIFYFAPTGDQSYILNVYVTGSGGQGNGYHVIQISATGGLTYPKQYEVGPNPKTFWMGDQLGSDVSFYGDVKAAKSANDAFGYVYRAQDAKNYYSVEFENGKLEVKKTVNGTATIVNSKAYNVVAGQTYTVQIAPEVGGFSVYVNKLKQFTISENSWNAGRFGILDRGHGGVTFNNLYTQASGATVGSISGVVLVNDTLDYQVKFDDPEKDPRITAGEKWTYTHNPNVFLNAQGTWSGKAQTAPVTTFSLPGEYTFVFKTKDDPNPSYLYPSTVFADYRQDSNEVTGKIRVHRKPIADFSVTADNTGKLTYTDRSYDPDRYNPSTGQYSTENTGINYASNHGVMDHRFRYWSADADVITEGKPDYLQNGTYHIEEAVVDEYGAWSDWAEATVTVKGVTRVPPNPGFTAVPSRALRGQTVTFDSYASDPVDGDRTNLAHAWYIRNVTTGGSESLQSNSRTTWDKVFSSLGIFNVRQVITNSAGLSAEANQTVEIYNRQPSVVITTPASDSEDNPTIFGSTRPQFAWTYTDPDSDGQTQFQLQIYKSNGSLVLDSGTQTGSAKNWAPPTDLPLGTVMYVTARVFDGYDWSNWSTVKYFRINRPPTGDFSWSPTLLYEGDTVTFKTAVSDPDNDTLDVTYLIESPEGEKMTYSYTWNSPYPTTGPSFVAITPGVWTATLTVSDRIAPAVTTSHTFRVWPLTISGQVRHTDAWEANRIRYNEKHPDDQRPADWFWAGEAFVLEALVTDTGESATKPIEVTADAGGGLRKALAAANVPLSLWNGTLGSQDAGRDLSELPEGAYTFNFRVVYSNGVVKTAQATIQIKGTVDEYIQVHRVQ
ncbi:hypothetical protein [Cohnella zeiphila]|uniref:PKD/Chitinase domain-containing protein n=1 Tax=Cohnella zeiphila TaxID=2761120 RepID=A0A7X0SG21_9BACL|nr:hypothetical protein [Cohnella zeiphila]MBB6729304.1 hypothetical protein [Cohnella zeiphila]